MNNTRPSIKKQNEIQETAKSSFSNQKKKTETKALHSINEKGSTMRTSNYGDRSRSKPEVSKKNNDPKKKTPDEKYNPIKSQFNKANEQRSCYIPSSTK